MLASEFVKSLQACMQGSRISQWLRTLEMLEADPILKEAELASLADSNTSEEFDKKCRKVFKNLSSGHQIVLLTINRLVESVEERTLVLLDEPESHLHPPLLSAFVRALSELLVHRNGVAIIATHSPVILQEVPKSCVWKLRRNGAEAIAERPEIETFGENVGTLTREVFGLEVTQSGFHKLIQDAVNQNKSFKQTIQMFDNELGSEARAILRALIIERDSEEEI
jgi:predicted ATP-dependent endonuclease of OLD family